jgi:hypothetical protein
MRNVFYCQVFHSTSYATGLRHLLHYLTLLLGLDGAWLAGVFAPPNRTTLQGTTLMSSVRLHIVKLYAALLISS